MYQNYIFDLYGTLADIHTREENLLVWEKLALFYGYQDALYTPEELRDAYGRMVQKLQEIGEASAGNTLTHSRLCLKEAAEKTKAGHEGCPEIQLEKVFDGLYRERGVEAKGELILHTGQMFRALATEYIRLYPGVREMLEKLREKGKGVYLLSNAQKMFTEYELHMLGITQYFDGILISSEYGVKKPDIRFFEILLKKYSLDPKTCIMIGNDASCDIEGAKGVGMDTCYIHSNLSPSGESGAEADYVLEEMNIDKMCRMLGI